MAAGTFSREMGKGPSQSVMFPGGRVEMDEFLFWKLTDSRFIADELIELVDRDIAAIQAIQEKRARGEPVPENDPWKKEISDDLKDLENKPVEDLKAVCVAHYNLLRVMPELMAQNNKRLLSLVISEVRDMM
jgi:hypothetical protein